MIDSKKYNRLQILYKRNLWRFCWDIMDCKIIDNSFHRKELARHDELRAKGMDRQMLWMWPREHLKTTLLTVGANLQRIAENPEITILLLSSTDKLVTKAVSAMSNIIINSEKFNRFFPYVRPTDPSTMTKSKYRFTVNRKNINLDATLEAVGLGGEITGSHFDVIDYDDVVTKKNVNTEEKRDKVKEDIDYTLSIMKRGGKRTFKGTRYDDDDYYSLIFKARDRVEKQERKSGRPAKNKWFISHRKMREEGGDGEEYQSDPDGTRYIFPQKFNSIEEDILRDPDTGQDEATFWAQYFNITSSKVNAIFKADDLMLYKHRPPFGHFFITCDSAGTTTGKSDRSAIVCCYWSPRTPAHPRGAIFAVRYLVGRFANSQIAAYLFDWYRDFKPELMSIEIPGGVSSGLWDYLMTYADNDGLDVTSMNFIPFKPHTIKESKHERISLLEPYVKEHRFLTLEEHVQLRNKLKSYRGHKNGKDDLLDATAQQLKIGYFPEITLDHDGVPEGADTEDTSDEYVPLCDVTGY